MILKISKRVTSLESFKILNSISRSSGFPVMLKAPFLLFQPSNKPKQTQQGFRWLHRVTTCFRYLTQTQLNCMLKTWEKFELITNTCPPCIHCNKDRAIIFHTNFIPFLSKSNENGRHCYVFLISDLVFMPIIHVEMYWEPTKRFMEFSVLKL